MLRRELRRCSGSVAEAGSPSPEAQLTFLRSLQRLLDEGTFTSSYKFALLHAIADLCVLQGDDSGDELALATSDIADRFVRLYWRHAAPFGVGDASRVLRQNTGRQAAVIQELEWHYQQCRGSLPNLEQNEEAWTRLRRSVENRIKRMPLWKLQTVGSERLDFLYDNVDGGSVIRLKPGVAYCFRAFHPMIVDMLQGIWLDFVQRRNVQLLGQIPDLRSFLFGTRRGSLAPFRSLLREVQMGRCFYCGRDVGSRGAVDHFIPVRRYSLHLGHNFVLAHKGCNSRKSDFLAAEEHLDRWFHRNRVRRDHLESGFDQRGVPHDWHATWQVARWAYGQVHSVGGQVWVLDKELRPLSGDWAEILAPGPDPAAETDPAP